MNYLNIVLVSAISILAFGLILVIVRFIKGPSLPDRVVSFDLFTALIIAIIGLLSMLWKNNVFIDVAVIISLISFLGAMSFSFYLNKRKKE